MTRKLPRVSLDRDRWTAIGHHALSVPFWKGFARVLVLCLGMILAGDILCHLIAESLWFSALGYEQVFASQITIRVGLWIFSLGATASLLVFNLRQARQRQYREPVMLSAERTTLPALVRYLVVVIGLSVLMACVLMQTGQTAFQFWQSSAAAPPQVLLQLSVSSLVALLRTAVLWQWVCIGGFTGLLIANPSLLFAAISVGLSLGMGLIFSSHWTQVLAAFQATSFNQVDPIFGRDIAFYIFALPVFELLRFWATATLLTSLLGVLLIYLLSGNSLSQGGMPGISPPQQRHLYGLSAGLMFTLAAGLWLDRFQLLYSTQGVLFGAGFTDSHVDLPARTLLSWGGVAIALFLTWRTCFWTKSRPRYSLLIMLGCYMGSVLLGAVILPQIVQSVIVQPNELRREQPYIERSIALTREAFDLGSVETKTFNPTAKLTPERLKANDITIRNIRLWDTRPLLEANRQLQRIRLYYEFPDADIDRYTLKAESNSTTATEKRQVLVSARELDYSAVPQKAQTWVNRHLIYTHGYGFTMSPVNIAESSGLPTYFVKDIGTEADAGTLQTATNEIRASIPTDRPRIYYGELTRNYVMTGTREKNKELDYPSGNDNVYNTYDGSGGIVMSSYWRRGIFAAYLRDWRMLFSRNFTTETRVLFRRQLESRVQTIAPFLQLDREPYLVAANGMPPSDTVQQPGTLYWMIDAYTTSHLFPYSDPGEESFNYIRNSVKVVVDAYNGNVTLYSIDETDPILRTWQQVFPGLFQPFSTMPPALRSHIRYPVDLFRAQSHSLLTYHMTDPQVFYNREDQWRIPNEIYGEKSQQVQPYYLTMKLPEAESEEFILLSPFTPVGRNNLIAWMAARSDGDSYGRRLLYQFPKRELVFGPEQIEALINQDPIISQQISLWDTQGSGVIQGNLLIVPIDNSLLYVEPLYLEAEETSVPILARVIVVYENQIVMAKTLDQALNGIFSPSDQSADAIVRPVEDLLPLRNDSE
ncbi:hypothetical protein C1752_06165 [Acaryochloris thomasi RCC1774]|uniref:UPF0182 protein C1752_06165 n=1 Tax=Acaryochloris thomasi RCC1774 TaxID=1764569 RepID=A0A2W1JJ66_9CYAN|nr:UPF0182 family protein [Acaryochloris thomasi]PZD71545.1 hypothetical protein C1752_06165 [Acaryochloris thomasi RCC1774]